MTIKADHPIRRIDKCFDWLAKSAEHLPHYQTPSDAVVLFRSQKPTSLLNKKEREITHIHSIILQRKNTITLVRNLFAATLVVTCASTLATRASAETVTPPPTPTQITPPQAQTAFLVGHAFGTQGYTLLPDEPLPDQPGAASVPIRRSCSRLPPRPHYRPL